MGATRKIREWIEAWNQSDNELNSEADLGSATKKLTLDRNERSKWNTEEVRELEDNDLVCIIDENVNRVHYKLGRVLEVYHESNEISAN